MKTIKGFKGFDKDLKCRGKQYAENTIFEEDGKLSLCEHGIHYCENPLDVLDYYNLCESEFAEIEDLGTPVKDETKSCTNKIQIKSKLGLTEFIKASIDFVFERCFTKGIEASSGNYAKQASSGYNAKHILTGKNSIAAAIGRGSMIKGIIGTWIVLAEYDDDNSVKGVKSAKIDGKRLKADTYYKLVNNKIVEVKWQH